jgi:hypothetical protein
MAKIEISVKDETMEALKEHLERRNARIASFNENHPEEKKDKVTIAEMAAELVNTGAMRRAAANKWADDHKPPKKERKPAAPKAPKAKKPAAPKAKKEAKSKPAKKASAPKAKKEPKPATPKAEAPTAPATPAPAATQASLLD